MVRFLNHVFMKLNFCFWIVFIEIRNYDLQGLLLDEQTGCLLKFSGELKNVSREDFHAAFSGHGRIKWVDFTRGANEVCCLQGFLYSLQKYGVLFPHYSGLEHYGKSKEEHGKHVLSDFVLFLCPLISSFCLSLLSFLTSVISSLSSPHL